MFELGDWMLASLKRRKNFLHLDKAKSTSLYLKLKMTHKLMNPIIICIFFDFCLTFIININIE